MKNNLQYASGHTEPMEKLSEWENEPAVKDLEDDLAIAKPGHDTHVTKIKKWINLRNVEGKSKPTEQKNRSSVQPKLVRRQNEWRYSALSEPFLSSDKMFELKPTTWEDKLAAEQNELILNWQFDTKLDRVGFFDEYCRTAVDEGSVIVQVGWERETKTTQVEAPIYEYVAAESDEDLMILEEALTLQRDNPNAFLDLDPAVQESAKYTAEMQMPALAQQVGVELVDEEKVVKNQPILTMHNYENFFLDPNAEGDIDKAGFAVISFETSQAKLKKDGRYKNLDKINWSSQSPLSQPDHVTQSDQTTQFKDEVRKSVVAYEYWGFYDVNGDGILVPIVATWIGKVMIRMEENPFPDQKLPFVAVSYMPVKKSITGEPDAELLEDNQAILGAVTRGAIDLLGRSANGQTGFAKGMLDVVNRKRMNAGSDYEFNPNMPPNVGIHQHSYPEIPQSALTLMQLQNQEAEAMTGVKAFSGGISGSAYGDVAAGIRGMLDAAAKREMGILRRLAGGIEKIGRKMAAMNAVFMSDEETVRVTNTQAVKVRRDELSGEFDLKVTISTAEIDEAQAQDLGFMMQTLGNTVDWSVTKLILIQIAKLKRLPDLAKAIESYEPQPDPMAEQAKQLELAKMQAEIDEIQSRAEWNRARARGEGSKADQGDLDFVEQETGTKHARDMDRLKAQGEANQDLEITKRILNPEEKGSKMDEIAGAITHKAMNKELT